MANRIVIANAFSLNMLPRDLTNITLHIRRLTTDEARDLISNSNLPLHSVVGHEDLAPIISNQLNTEIPYNRETYIIQEGDELLIAQYIGPRLPEGTRELPEGATIQYFHITFSPEN